MSQSQTIVSKDPFTGETLAELAAHGWDEVDRRLALAARAFRPPDGGDDAGWAGTPLDRRLEVLLRAADLLDARAGTYGLLMTREMGKPISAAHDELEKCARACRYYAENAS